MNIQQKNLIPDENAAALLDSFSTPKKSFRVSTKNGITNITTTLSASAKKAHKALYRFKRESDGKCYIGHSVNPLKRIGSHLSNCRHPEKDAGKSALAKAVQKNAKRVFKGKEDEVFSVGILLEKKDLPAELQHLSMAEIEQLYIDNKKSQGVPLFNKRRGGGGGYGKSKKSVTATAQEVDAFVKKLHETYKSPAKSYPINPDTLKVELTPSVKNGKIYAFKDITNSKRYIGKTERDTIDPRMAEHSSHARHSEKEIGNKPLYKDIREQPKKFRVQVIDTEQFETKDLDLIERGLIQYHKEKKTPLYNKNGGGGGGHIVPGRLRF